MASGVDVSEARELARLSSEYWKMRQRPGGVLVWSRGQGAVRCGFRGRGSDVAEADWLGGREKMRCQRLVGQGEVAVWVG